MTNHRISRRSFLKKTGSAAVASYAAAEVAGIGFISPGSEALAASLKSMNQNEGKSLLAVTRQLYPHDRIEDKYYWVVVKSVDGTMAKDNKLRRTIGAGLARLDKLAGGQYHKIGKSKQLAALKKMEGSDFMSTMIGKTNIGFYNNPEVWPKFGYQGSSWEKGGYKNRGFDDIDWL